MISKEDRKQLIEEMKEIFVTREEFNEKFAMIMKTMDMILKELQAIRQELHAINYRLDRIEGWVMLAAPKIGVPFEP